MRDVGQYDQLVREATARWARALGVVIPFDLVKRMIGVESSFDPGAIRRESDGRISRGLMQVLEPTARDLGLANPMRLHEPATGIDYGVKYLGRQLARYGGDIVKAVAAYNAGTARTTSSGRFVNQGYVNKVLGATRAAIVPLALAAAAVLAVFVIRRRRRGSHA